MDVASLSQKCNQCGGAINQPFSGAGGTSTGSSARFKKTCISLLTYFTPARNLSCLQCMHLIYQEKFLVGIKFILTINLFLIPDSDFWHSLIHCHQLPSKTAQFILFEQFCLFFKFCCVLHDIYVWNTLPSSLGTPVQCNKIYHNGSAINAVFTNNFRLLINNMFILRLQYAVVLNCSKLNGDSIHNMRGLCHPSITSSATPSPQMNLVMNIKQNQYHSDHAYKNSF